MNQLRTCGLVILTILLLSDVCMAQSTPLPNGRRLREIVADKYPEGNLLIGATTGEWAFNTATGEIMDREFSYVTPENDFKQPQIHPDNGGWRWTKPDRWINHIKYNKQTLRIHGPVGPQCSNWAKGDTRTAAELELNMRMFMTELCKRYNNRDGIKYLDVVNETIINGNWHRNKAGTDWENPWYIIGQDNDVNKTPLYIKYAFEIANEHAPNLKLIFNQHEKTIENSTWGKIKKTIAYLRNQGLRVDGIGWQAHLYAGWEKIEGQPEALRNLIDWAHQNDLEFHITEQSVYISSTSESEYKKQAETYKAIIDILVEKSLNGKIGWNTWHIDEGHGWVKDRYPAIFDAAYRAKPAYYAIQLALETKGDYTSQHRVKFQLKNRHTGQWMNGCQVKFNNETKDTESNGEVDFMVSAGIYDVKASKQFAETLDLKNLSVYSDTIFTLLMDTTEIKYDITFELIDNYTGNSISSVEVDLNSVKQTTNTAGNTVFQFATGNYTGSFTKTNYFNFEKEFQINSDTTIQVGLNKSHATIKFRVKEGSQPINKARTILGSDTLYSTSLGISRFKSVPIGSSYNFSVEKDFFYSVSGNLNVVADTTISIQLNKYVANIEFVLSSGSGTVKNAFVVLNKDTAWFNEQGKSKLYNLTKGEMHTYQVFSDSHEQFNDSLQIANDTLLFVFLTTGLYDINSIDDHIKVYPNPAKNAFQFESNVEINCIKVYQLNGEMVRAFKVNSNKQELNTSDWSPGKYILRFERKSQSTPYIQKMIIQR